MIPFCRDDRAVQLDNTNGTRVNAKTAALAENMIDTNMRHTVSSLLSSYETTIPLKTLPYATPKEYEQASKQDKALHLALLG